MNDSNWTNEIEAKQAGEGIFAVGTRPWPRHLQGAQTNLTPAAPVSSTVLPPSEVDIRDIRQPRHIPLPWPLAVAAAGVFNLSAEARRITKPKELNRQTI